MNTKYLLFLSISFVHFAQSGDTPAGNSSGNIALNAILLGLGRSVADTGFENNVKKQFKKSFDVSDKTAEIIVGGFSSGLSVSVGKNVNLGTVISPVIDFTKSDDKVKWITDNVHKIQDIPNAATTLKNNIADPALWMSAGIQISITMAIKSLVHTDCVQKLFSQIVDFVNGVSEDTQTDNDPLKNKIIFQDEAGNEKPKTKPSKSFLTVPMLNELTVTTGSALINWYLVIPAAQEKIIDKLHPKIVNITASSNQQASNSNVNSISNNNNQNDSSNSSSNSNSSNSNNNNNPSLNQLTNKNLSDSYMNSSVFAQAAQRPLEEGEKRTDAIQKGQSDYSYAKKLKEQKNKQDNA